MIAHNKPTLGIEEEKAAGKVLQSGWVAQGPQVSAFEADLAEYLGIAAEQVVLVSSGTAALYLALWALGARPNMQIGLPVYACSALRNAVAFSGAKPVYIDTKEDLPNINPDQIKNVEFEILVAASMFGIPVVIDGNYSYAIIEDIAQAFGAGFHDQFAGLVGDVGICSFYATKLITSGGQGGAVFGKNRELIDLIRDFRAFDCRKDQKIRFNFHMTDLQAAIGRIQLSRLPEFLEKRMAILDIYKSVGLPIVETDLATVQSIPYRAAIKTANAVRMIETLKKNGIIAIIPVEDWELLDSNPKFVNSRNFTKCLVSIPLYPSLSLDMARKIANIVIDIL